MTDPRSSSALFKRAEQLKRWEESDTNKQSSSPKRESRIQFSPGIVFLAACTSGDKEEVQRLLKMGADINTANVDGLTALHQACIDDNLEMVEFLVEHGADVNRGDNEGWTPLHATASCGFLSIARYLLENGADVAAVNYDGELSVDIAESDKMEELLQKVIDDKGIDCEKSRNAEVNKLLSDAKNWAAHGYVEVRDPKTGGTPLHVAAAKGYIDVAQTLLDECNVDPDCVDYEGWSPLHAAALWGQKEAAAILIKYGADPNLKNYSGQTCLDLVDPSISTWLAEAALKAPRRINNNNNNINKLKSPLRNDVKRVELQITGQDDNIINDKPPAPEIVPKADCKPPKRRAPSPEAEFAENEETEDAPSWRRSASFRNRQQENSRENKPSNNNLDNDTILRRTHSFENDKTFYQRYRDVTARIKASSCPSIPPTTIEIGRTNNVATNEDAHNRVSATDRREKETPNTSAATSTTTTQTSVRRISPTERRDRDVPTVTSANASPTNTQSTVRRISPTERSGNASPTNTTQTTVRRSFVPPVRDEESETQRKAHAKRVRETRRSTQGVTLDEIKSAEQLVKKKAGNGTDAAPAIKNNDDSHINTDQGRGKVGLSLALACATATATATIAPNSERRPSWRLRVDPTNKFELEDAGRSSPRTTAPAAEATVTLPLRRSITTSPTNVTNNAATIATTAVTAATITNATTTTTIINDGVNKEDLRTEEDKERESSLESKSSSSPASTQAAMNVIQRRRRPKRRSTGVGHVDMDDIVNDRGGGGEGDGDTDNVPSGSERTEDGEETDYKVLYEASQVEVRRLRGLLSTSEQQLRDARATITKLTQVNQNSLSEIEKREKRAMERKLSEMEEELRQLQKLKAENERLRAENRALTRVVSKLTNSAAK
ncbi:protein phosphatase 1 regulatory subunit 12C isoform X3 [Danaus plexippus]|uniref:protein phosphatase 1 regulatory subunit 12C isoform X3 n=1 Tax=Danaus plexippus TaxID=13037 RepID=UPI002AB2FA40|nr:protein phosphatase 1 regulatory subunit 12C isoform X3 [Danaus plexippus]